MSADDAGFGEGAGLSVTTRRLRSLGAIARRAIASLSAAAAMLLCGIEATQNVVANGDTRTISILHEHTKESASVTFRRNGQYDSEGLKQLNWLLRDWRLDQPTQMDPRLFDIVWQVYREVGAREPIHVMSAYRAPETNAALRRRSRAVSEHSQHMHGKAMDFYIPEVSMVRVREIGMRLQHGGVGFYPNSMHSFVHLDAGSVRSWPRMPAGDLARLFPDGRTVHIPRHGKPLPGYEEAKAQILARGGSVAGYSAYAEAEEAGPRKSLWATLFGGGDDEDSEFYRSAGSRTAAAPSTRVAAYAPSGNSDDAGTRSFFSPSQPEASGLRRGRGPSPLAMPAATGDTPPPGLEPPTAPVLPAPMPPRRPSEIGSTLAALSGGPTGSAVSAQAGQAFASSPDLRGEMRPPTRASTASAAADDDRAALRTLFQAAATPIGSGRRADVPTARALVRPIAVAAALLDPAAKVRMTFSSVSLDEPSPGGFSGPAVSPLPVLR